MKIVVDRDKCSGLGICESVCPDFFEINGDGVLDLLAEDVPADRLDEVLEAVDGCPTEALHVEP
jgi:ferredoxin